MLNQVSPAAAITLGSTNEFLQTIPHKVSLTRAESFPGLDFLSFLYQP
jgi:hypothetical protein